MKLDLAIEVGRGPSPQFRAPMAQSLAHRLVLLAIMSAQRDTAKKKFHFRVIFARNFYHWLFQHA
jgi:hypothetical protein